MMINYAAMPADLVYVLVDYCKGIALSTGDEGYLIKAKVLESIVGRREIGEEGEEAA